MLLLDADLGFCANTANIWQVVGYLVLIIKIVIPLLLIVLGMVDLGKAVVNNDDKSVSKAVSTLIRRFIAAIIVFFIPTIVNALFSAVGVISKDNTDYMKCVECVTNATSSACEGYASSAVGAIQ